MGKVVYKAFEKDYYPRLDDLLQTLVDRYELTVLYFSGLTPSVYLIQNSVPRIFELYEWRSVYVLGRDCDQQKIPNNVYILVRPFEHPVSSDLFRVTPCLYKSIADAFADCNPVRILVTGNKSRSAANEDHVVQFEYGDVEYPYRLYRINGLIRKISSDLKNNNTTAFRRFAREIYTGLSLEELLLHEH